MGAILAAAVVSLLAAGIVTAALFLILEPAGGPPGTAVTGRTAGNGAFLARVDPMPAYLVRRSVADEVTTPDDPDLIALGELIVDTAGNGLISFLVPNVEPGDYVVMISCPACASTSAGRTMLVLADFKVISSPPNTDTLEGAPVGRVGPSELVVLIAAVVTVVALRRHLAG